MVAAVCLAALVYWSYFLKKEDLFESY